MTLSLSLKLKDQQTTQSKRAVITLFRQQNTDGVHHSDRQSRSCIILDLRDISREQIEIIKGLAIKLLSNIV